MFVNVGLLFLYNRSWNSKILQRREKKCRLCEFSSPWTTGMKGAVIRLSRNSRNTSRVKAQPAVNYCREQTSMNTRHLRFSWHVSLHLFRHWPIPSPPHDFYLRENIGELEIATGGGGTRYSNWPSLITWNWWQRGKEKCNTLEYENFLYSMNIKWQSLSWL